MADGTHIEANGSLVRNGKPINVHVLASSFLALGTHVHFTHRVFGSENWTVRDTGGEFDLYVPNCKFGRWNNPRLYYTTFQ